MATLEHYETRRAALAGIAWVEKNAPSASTVDAEDQVAIKKTANPTRKATAKKSS